MISVPTACALFGLIEKALKQIPIIPAVPGDYGTVQKTKQRRIRLVSHSAAQNSASQFTAVKRKWRQGWRAACVEIRLWRVARRSPPGPPGEDDLLHYMCYTAVPYFDIPRQRIERGVCCHGCEYDWYKREGKFPHGYNIPREV